MKKVLVNIMISAAAVVAASLNCSIAFATGDEDKIVMTIEDADKINVSIGCAETVTIDWGDGSENETFDESMAEASDYDKYLLNRCSHEYSSASAYTVTITGKNITHFISSGNKVTGLDVSRNTALTVLFCEDGKLTELDVSQNKALTLLVCGKNKLTGLDVSQNQALTQLDCNRNKLTRLDVSKNEALTEFDCTFNQLTGLNVSKNTALKRFSCGSNQLTNLDVSKNIELTKLDCWNNKLTRLDVSRNKALTQLCCQTNQLTGLDVRNNTALKDLWCEFNRLTGLDVRNNIALTNLDCWSNQLTGLDVSKNTMLTLLNCGNNKLKKLDVSRNTALIRLVCSKNKLTGLDVSRNTALTVLHCGDNSLTGLDVSKNTALKDLYCDANQLKTLDVRKNTALQRLYCVNSNFSANALNALFKTLHGYMIICCNKTIVISDNPGTDGCNPEIAEDNGWTVYSEHAKFIVHEDGENTKKAVTKLYFIDAETGKETGIMRKNRQYGLCFETKGYSRGETVRALVRFGDGKEITDNVTELIFSGIVDENGWATSTEIYDNNKDDDNYPDDDELYKPVHASFLEYQDEYYNICNTAFYDDDEHIFISIKGNGDTCYEELPAEFDLYFDLKKENNEIPMGSFRYDSTLPADDDSVIKYAGFVRLYPDWYVAEHVYRCRQLNLNIQDLDDGDYSISGEMILDNPANDTVKFNYSGAMKRESCEVSFIYGYSPTDFTNSVGAFTIDGKKITTPYAFQKWKGYSNVKIYLLDRDLCLDKELLYGVRFELELKHPIEGKETFIYHKDEEYETSNCIVAFFNQTVTEYPDHATVTISKTRQEVYRVDYTLTFSDDRTVKGFYSGKIPERNK